MSKHHPPSPQMQRDLLKKRLMLLAFLIALVFGFFLSIHRLHTQYHNKRGNNFAFNLKAADDSSSELSDLSFSSKHTGLPTNTHMSTKRLLAEHEQHIRDESHALVDDIMADLSLDDDHKSSQEHSQASSSPAPKTTSSAGNEPVSPPVKPATPAPSAPVSNEIPVSEVDVRPSHPIV